MAKITALETQKRDPNRVNVHLDGEYAFSLARIVAAWLQVGQELEAQKIEALQAQDASERAYQQAMLFLSYRARSTAEIRQNLKRHKLPPEAIEETIERLKAEKLADDGQFAKAWVENRSTFRPRSRMALSVELRQKGIPEEAARAALTDVDEETLAYDAALKRARRLESLEWNEFRTKLSQYLGRRGFSYAVAASVVSRTWDEIHKQDPKENTDDEETS
jgi:regulatory protein